MEAVERDANQNDGCDEQALPVPAPKSPPSGVQRSKALARYGIPAESARLSSNSVPTKGKKRATSNTIASEAGRKWTKC